jgi:hypothetical protein
MTKNWYVNYKAEGFGAYQAGPYSSSDEAYANSSDIKSYAGISEVYVTGRRDETRELKP